MKPLSADTPLEVERVWLAMQRERGPLWRLRRCVEMTSFSWRAAKDAVKRAHPDESKRQWDHRLLEHRYGREIANGVIRTGKEPGMVEQPELWEAILPAIDALESLEVDHYIGGSVASSFLGVSRATQDADLVADLRIGHASPFMAALRDTYYLSEERILKAIRRKKSFNLIHFKTAFKIDVFLVADTPFARESLARRVNIEIPELSRELHFSSPEDTILNKLQWYEMGNRVSDRQWYDLQGILRIQAENLDLELMREWAGRLGLSELLEEALSEKPDDD